MALYDTEPGRRHAVFVRLPFFGGLQVSSEQIPDSGFGIEKRPSTDNGIGDLPSIPEGLQGSQRDMQIFAHFVLGQIAFPITEGRCSQSARSKARSALPIFAKVSLTSSFSPFI